MHSSKLDALLIFQCYASSMLFIHTPTFVVFKNRRSYDIADVAKLSFQARTRNLMIMACSMCFFICRWHCAGIGIRSLVLARDDAVVGICNLVGVYF